MTIKIKPASPTPEQKDYLKLLFKQQHDTIFWSADLYHTIDYQGKKLELALKQSIIRRESKKGGERFDLSDIRPDNILGAGTFGTVYGSKATLKLNQQDELEVKRKSGNNERAIKVVALVATEHRTISETLAAAEEEFRLCQATPHMHVKKPVWNKINLYIVMRRLHGKELFQVIINDNGASFLSILQRFRLSFAVIDALQYQVFDVNLVHCDLKPENIIVNRTLHDQFIAYIIDLGLAKRMNANRLHDDVGSLAYASPESLQMKKTTQLSDVYSLGRILALIWRVSLTSYDPKSSQQVIDNARENNYEKMFNAIPNLHHTAKFIIQCMVETMTAFNPQQRLYGVALKENQTFNVAVFRKELEEAYLLQFPDSEPLTTTCKPRTSFTSQLPEKPAKRSIDAPTTAKTASSPSPSATTNKRISNENSTVSIETTPSPDFLKSHGISVSGLKTGSNKLQKEVKACTLEVKNQGKKLLQKAGNFFLGTPKSKRKSAESAANNRISQEGAKVSPPDIE